MKYLKNFETVKGAPEIGDYIIIVKAYGSEKLINFITNTVGKIVRKNKSIIDLKYNNIPKELESEIDDCYILDEINNSIVISTNTDIRYATDDEIKKYILDSTANKYNL